MLTLAYDSDKQESRDDDSLLQVIDPDTYYTLYGDKTEQRFDAASAEKVYVKLEREQFYALFGDIETGLTVTELARYSHSLTGFKTEFDNRHYELNAFAAESDLAFTKDEIQGNGTSGLYRLSQQNIIPNSDKVTIETRDRFRSDIVLETRSLTRHIDYNIDLANGTVFFKQPIFSQDESFNPIFIVADYEVKSAQGKSYTAGGRAAAKFIDERLEVGVSGIQEGDTGTDGKLFGVDATYKLNSTTEFHSEIATSDTDRGQEDGSGNAYVAEVTHKGERLDGRVYVREQEEGFGVGQQNGSEAGTRKGGVDARYHLTDKLDLNSELYREEVRTTDAQRDVAATALEYREDKYSLSGGFRHARDQLGDGEKNTSNLVLAGASREVLDKRVNLRANTEVAVAGSDNPDYPTRLILGSDFRVTQSSELFAEQEFTYGSREDSNSTRVGVRTQPWNGATINSTLENQISEYGPRLFANLGLAQAMQVSEHLSVDFGIDRSETIRDPGDTPFNTNVPPASGTAGNDFTAMSVGASYTQELWSFASRLESRIADLDDQYGVTLGFYRQQTAGLGLSLGGQYLTADTDSGNDMTTGDLRFSVAYRPVKSTLIALNRLDLNYAKTANDLIADRQRKLINNFTMNWLPNRTNQLALHHGVKYTVDSFDDDEYGNWLQVMDTEYRHDITRRFDFGIQSGILHSVNAQNYSYSLGGSLGMNLIKNTWVSAGYNITGFEDDDFTSAGYTAQGPYIKLRFAFDQNTVKDSLKWFEKK